MSITEIMKGLLLLHKAGEIVELCAPGVGDYSPTISGWYDDLDELAADIDTINTKFRRTVFTVMNPLKADGAWPLVNNKWYLGNRAMRAEIEAGDKVFEPRMTKKYMYETGKSYIAMRRAKDTDIDRRKRVLLDVDAGQPEHNNSSAEEHGDSLAYANAVRDYLVSIGFPRPALTNSGNGHHGYLTVDLANTDASRVLVERFLKSVAQRFDGHFGKAHLDAEMYDAKRLTKASGTVVYKGVGTPERPCRRSAVLDIGDDSLVTKQQLESVGEEYAGEVSSVFTGRTGPAIADTALKAKVDWVIAWLDFNGLELRTVIKDGTFYKVGFECPNVANHSGFTGELETVITVAPDGSLGARCLHNCQDESGDHAWKSWKGQGGLRVYMMKRNGAYRSLEPTISLAGVVLNGQGQGKAETQLR